MLFRVVRTIRTMHNNNWQLLLDEVVRIEWNIIVIIYNLIYFNLVLFWFCFVFVGRFGVNVVAATPERERTAISSIIKATIMNFPPHNKIR